MKQVSAPKLVDGLRWCYRLSSAVCFRLRAQKVRGPKIVASSQRLLFTSFQATSEDNAMDFRKFDSLNIRSQWLTVKATATPCRYPATCCLAGPLLEIYRLWKITLLDDFQPNTSKPFQESFWQFWHLACSAQHARKTGIPSRAFSNLTALEPVPSDQHGWETWTEVFQRSFP